MKNTVEINIFYKIYKKRTEIYIIRGQNWKIVLGMLWLAHHNSEIDWKTKEIKMKKCTEEYGKQWRPVQKKLR